ncbi:MAG TPA: aconitase X [Streptosporangiaceae bacterium]|nr:aconitase X [Streptosporangiaceae bacterium]
MILTDDEKRMRDGAEGAAVAAAMDLLIRYGDALACERLCDVRNVAGSMTQPSPVKERLVREGGWDKAFAVINLDSDARLEVPAMRVPVCQLQHGFGSDAARTNCEGLASSGAAGLTGKIPCWGNHRDENRHGTHLVDVRTRVDSFLDWGMLGYFAGEETSAGPPGTD